MVRSRTRTAAPTQHPSAGRKGERDCTLLVWCRCEQRGDPVWRSRMLIPRFELTLHARLLRPAPASCALWPWLLLRACSCVLAEWLCVRGSRNHGRNTEVTRDTTGSVKTTRRVARLETVSVSSFLKSYAYDRSIHCTSKEPELMYVLHRLPCADLRWTAPYLASYVFSCVFNKRSDPSCEGRIAGSLLSALHACTETEL